MGCVKWEASQWKDSEELMFDGERGGVTERNFGRNLEKQVGKRRKTNSRSLSREKNSWKLIVFVSL